jgi:hypothetical protein
VRAFATYPAAMGLRLSLLAAALLACASGCASETEPTTDDTIEEAVDELNINLRDFAIVKATMTEAGTITVAYQPELYAPSTLRVPFLAIELPPRAETNPGANAGGIRPTNGTASANVVRVEGDFPGAPQLVVTDGNFRPIATSRGRRTEVGAEAAIRVAPNRGKFVLVRDQLWVKPMTFQVTVGQ